MHNVKRLKMLVKSLAGLSRTYRPTNQPAALLAGLDKQDKRKILVFDLGGEACLRRFNPWVGMVFEILLTMVTTKLEISDDFDQKDYRPHVSWVQERERNWLVKPADGAFSVWKMQLKRLERPFRNSNFSNQLTVYHSWWRWTSPLGNDSDSC